MDKNDKMNKIIYYYLEKYPSAGIKEFEVCDIEYRCYESDDDNSKKRITAIESYYDITYEIKSEREYAYTYNVYQPYEDERIFEHDREPFSPVIMSFDREAIEETWIHDIKRYESIHGKNVDKCREILSEKC